MKHWHPLHINSNLAAIFRNSAILAFRENKNLRDIIGTKLIEKGKVKRKSTNKIQGKCTSYLVNNRTLGCKQVTNATMFRKSLTNRTFQIYHNLKCKSKYIIYLLECTECKMQYIGKAKTEFSIKLKNHQKNVWKTDTTPASRQFSDKQHNIAGLISGITFIVLFQSGEASTVEGNKHTHTHSTLHNRNQH